MGIEFLAPQENTEFLLGKPVLFRGKVDGVPAVKVTVETMSGSDLIHIATVNVNVGDGTWFFKRAFNQPGNRTLTAEAINSEGDVLATDQIKIRIKKPAVLLPFKNLPNDQPFKDGVVEMSKRLGADPNHILAVMAFETGSTFSPSIKNPDSGATGLIQFMPSTAAGLGTTTAALAAMSRTEQLVFVEKHFKPFKGKLKSVEDCYMAVLFPVAVGKPNNFVLFKKPTIQFAQNAGLDVNQDGKVTKDEAASKPRGILKKAGG